MRLDLSARLAERGLDVELVVEEGETVALLGPNGSGKSTILSILAGLVRPDEGTAELDGTTLFRLNGDSSLWRPSYDRGIGLLAQDALLFPHLSARDNVAFGPRSLGRGRAAANREALRWLGEVDATELADRKPGQLSGGQAQRVALARALATEPGLLLLDEPMAALDVTTVPQMRALLRRVLEGRSSILVTHDVLDALLLADRVVVLTDGRIMEAGPTREVLSRPRSLFGAQVAGLNLVRGRADGDGVVDEAGRHVRGMAEPALVDGAPAVAVFSPAAVAVHAEPLRAASPRNVFDATISELEPHGAQVRVRTDVFSADITAAAVADLRLAPGARIQLAVKASEVHVYPA